MKQIQKEDFRKKQQKRKGQNVAEYAILISLVIGSVLAMQTFVKRGLQARTRDTTQWMVEETDMLGDTGQYEPYFFESSYEVEKGVDEVKTLTGDTNFEIDSYGRTHRQAGGYQRSTYEVSHDIGDGMKFGSGGGSSVVNWTAINEEEEEE
ncbi:MAG: hypothetical protein P9M07_02090 [Candidatus Aceula meridiana]|nr:hypothetical protein [Candidatus Aceula meridiana]